MTSESNSKSQKPPTAAYESATRRDRFTEQALNIILIILTLTVNWVLLIAGFERLWGLYATLLFIATLIVVDVVRLSASMFGAGWQDSTGRVPAPFTHDDVRVYIVVWLVWFTITEFFFISGKTYGTVVGALVSVPMLVVTLLVSVYPLERSLLRNIFLLLALLVVAFPSRNWMPQYEWWVLGVLRAALYFVAVCVASYALPRRELAPDRIQHEIATALSVRNASAPHAAVDEQPDEEDAERVVFGTHLLTIVTHYHELCNYERERRLSVIALSAWILLVSWTVVIVFGVVLSLAQTFLFFIRRHEYVKQQQQIARDAVQRGTKPPSVVTSAVATAVGAPSIGASEKTSMARANGVASKSNGMHHSTGVDETSAERDDADDTETSLEASNDTDDGSGAAPPELPPVHEPAKRRPDTPQPPSDASVLRARTSADDAHTRRPVQRGVKTSVITIKPKA